MTGSSLNAVNYSTFLNYRYWHNDNIKEILPFTLKHNNDFFRGNVSMDVAPYLWQIFHQKEFWFYINMRNY